MATTMVTPRRLLWLCIAAVIIGCVRLAWIPQYQQARARLGQAEQIEWTLKQSSNSGMHNADSASALQALADEAASLTWAYYYSDSENGALAALLRNMQKYANESGISVQSAAPRRSVKEGLTSIAISLNCIGQPSSIWRMLYLLSSSVPLHVVSEVSILPAQGGNIRLDMVVEAVWQPAGSSSPGPVSISSSNKARVPWETLQHLSLFAPKEARHDFIPQLTLTGIVLGKPHSVAMVRDAAGASYAVKAGDSVAGATVIRIESDRVLMRSGNTEYVLSLVD